LINRKQVISGSEDGNVIVWNFKPQMRPYKFIGHKGAILDLAISPNGNTIASASNDETVRLWTNSV
jgi:centriolar protein POC1